MSDYCKYLSVVETDGGAVFHRCQNHGSRDAIVEKFQRISRDATMTGGEDSCVFMLYKRGRVLRECPCYVRATPEEQQTIEAEAAKILSKATKPVSE